MKKTGWQGAANSFIISMERSIEIALSIIYYHWARLDAHKGEGTWQLDMFTDFDVPAQHFIELVGTKYGDFNTQKTLTSLFESEFSQMSPNLDNFDSLTRDIHPVNSEDYRIIWGANRNRFYTGNYQGRLAELKALADVMTAKSVPLGATAVMDYHASIIAHHNEQQKTMTKVGNDAKEVEKYRQILIQKLYKNCGGLIFHFGDDEDCQTKVNGYFPLNLLGDRSIKGHYQLIVPKAEFRKIGMHTFKAGEKVEITATGADVWLSMADNSNHSIASGYKAVNGATVNIDPLLLGDLTKKYIIATNVNLTTSCDLILNINKA